MRYICYSVAGTGARACLLGEIRYEIYLLQCGWYWGPLIWEEAEQKLANKPEGSFLVRDSSDDRYILSLSFKNQGRVHHTRIEHHRGRNCMIVYLTMFNVFKNNSYFTVLLLG